MKNKIVSTVILALFMLMTSLAQTSTNIIYQEDPVITKIMEKYKKVNRSSVVSGWRVQVMASTDRTKVEETQRGFKIRYPSVGIDWIHQKPYYKLLAGAYNSKWEANALLYMIKGDYSGSFIMQDNNIKQIEMAGLTQ